MELEQWTRAASGRPGAKDPRDPSSPIECHQGLSSSLHTIHAWFLVAMAAWEKERGCGWPRGTIEGLQLGPPWSQSLLGWVFCRLQKI
jgi:hypothetical protein